MVISYFSGKNVWWQVFYLCQFVLDTAENCEQLQNVPKNLKCQHQFLLHAKFITVLNVVTARKCFHGCLSFCPRGGGYLADIPPGETPPVGRHPPHPGRHPPPQQTATAADGGTHPTGMHSCDTCTFSSISNFLPKTFVIKFHSRQVW